MSLSSEGVFKDLLPNTSLTKAADKMARQVKKQNITFSGAGGVSCDKSALSDPSSSSSRLATSRSGFLSLSPDCPTSPTSGNLNPVPGTATNPHVAEKDEVMRLLATVLPTFSYTSSLALWLLKQTKATLWLKHYLWARSLTSRFVECTAFGIM